YVGGILAGQTCRIVLCSLQYRDGVQEALDYFVNNGFSIYVQWLNPCFRDHRKRIPAKLGLMDRVLGTRRALVAMRNGKESPGKRIGEIREIIYGWAVYRDLIVRC